MANNYFQFKQFKINQDIAAMKVGTDGVLLGAWVDLTDVQNVLDAGTGTGLIALMMAQRYAKSKITAIDIDPDACRQAAENFTMSQWSDRLDVVNVSIQSFRQNQNGAFDLIVCNPPFFQNSFKSDCSKRNLARHTDSLSAEDLIRSASMLSTDCGRLAVVIPEEQSERFIELSHKYFYNLVRSLHVKPNKMKPTKRRLLEFKKHFTGEFQENEIFIETAVRHFYSNEYKELTKEFYLAF